MKLVKPFSLAMISIFFTLACGIPYQGPLPTTHVPPVDLVYSEPGEGVPVTIMYLTDGVQYVFGTLGAKYLIFLNEISIGHASHSPHVAEAIEYYKAGASQYGPWKIPILPGEYEGSAKSTRTTTVVPEGEVLFRVSTAYKLYDESGQPGRIRPGETRNNSIKKYLVMTWPVFNITKGKNHLVIISLEQSGEFTVMKKAHYENGIFSSGDRIDPTLISQINLQEFMTNNHGTNSGECNVNSDCSEGMYCQSMKCFFDCKQDRDCGIDEMCDQRNGTCVKKPREEEGE